MIRYYHCNSTGVSFVLKIPLVLKAKGTSTYRGDRRSLYIMSFMLTAVFQ